MGYKVGRDCISLRSLLCCGFGNGTEQLSAVGWYAVAFSDGGNAYVFAQRGL